MIKPEILQLRAQLSDVYKDYRNMCLNKLYYAERLHSTIRRNFWYEVVLAVCTSGAVAGWAIWGQPGWKTAWIVIGAIVSIFTIIKPILNYSGEIERFTTLETKFNALQIDFELLCFDIKTKQLLDKTLIKQYRAIKEKTKTLGVKEDSAVSEKVLRRLQEKVNREIPADKLWSPE